MSTSILKMAEAEAKIGENDLPLLGRAHILSFSHKVETIEIFDGSGVDKVQLGNVITVRSRFMATVDPDSKELEEDPSMKIMQWIEESAKKVSYRHILTLTLGSGDIVTECLDFPNAYILGYKEINDENMEDSHVFELKIAQKRSDAKTSVPYKRGDIYKGFQMSSGEDQELREE